MVAKVRINEWKTKFVTTKNRKKQRLFSTSFYFNSFFYEIRRITFRDSRQKPLTSYVLWHDVKPKRGGRSSWPFFHGSRACSRDGDCGAEMFFSLLFTYLFVTIFTDLGCKSTHFFWITQENCEIFHFSLFTFHFFSYLCTRKRYKINI